MITGQVVNIRDRFRLRPIHTIASTHSIIVSAGRICVPNIPGKYNKADKMVNEYRLGGYPRCGFSPSK